ncbi:hypothetical protein TRIATDRAFT_314854 [Trichoderma atroviride IMI 206040]|uniref:SNF2 N-terminal domain-containing protein n=1 Tax=Hypocrea atroviridis (strain ATCC 20476 / IMI 206040) TaxID=452589 RepID=G9NHC1_HYPAI|nr:uncharacterized protein TRIATDRAFT_314854 [Trichoderma atroviride IMI 206040]EHK50015.1 hypothetical protein TRIATDRAFT_314854 [Trichoderma atroviride IMI 206040]
MTHKKHEPQSNAAYLVCIHDKMKEAGHCLRCNKMGLGKTMVFAAYIKYRARELEKDNDHRNPKSTFFLLLIINPVNTIHQIHKELKINFPTLNMLLYYAGTTQSKKYNSATIIAKSKFVQKLAALSPTDPESARTVVVTTYSTLHAKEITKSERKLVIQERRGEGNAPKGDDRNSVPRGEGDKVEFDNAESG